MPLTKKGRKVMAAMKEEYGVKKGERVFYASENAGRIAGVHAKGGSTSTSAPPKRGRKSTMTTKKKTKTKKRK